MLCFFFITFLIRSLFCNRRGCCMHATTVIIYCLLPVHHSQMRQYNYTIFRQTTPWAPGLYTATRFKKSLLFHVVRISTTLILRVNDIYMLTTLSTWISVHMCITYVCLTHHILDCNNQLNPILRREETKVECVWQHSYLTCTWLSDNPMCTCNAEQQHWCLVHIRYLRSCSHLSINNLKTNNGIWFLPYRLKRNQMVLKAVFHDSDQEDLHTKSQQCHRVIATLVQYCRSILPCFVMWLLCCLFFTWERSCFFRLVARLKVLPHFRQLWSLLPECTTKCSLRSPHLRKRLSQVAQPYGRSSECILLCLARALVSLNFLLHWPQL